MSNTPKRPLAQVMPVAEKILEALAPYAHEISFAGSLRRKKTEVGDIEIVALPKFTLQKDLFGNPFISDSHLFVYLEEQERQGNLKIHNSGGDLYKKFSFTTSRGVDYEVDVFTATEQNYGNILAIRTGSSAFSTYLMVHLKSLGMIHSGGYLYKNGVMIPCRTEEEFFNAIQHPYIAPQHRSNQEQWQLAMRDTCY